MKYLILIVLILILIYLYFNYINKNVYNIKENEPIIYFLGDSKPYEIFEDYVDSLAYKLRKNNVKYKIYTQIQFTETFFKYHKSNIYYVIIHTTDILDITTTTKQNIIKNTYIINTEQLTRKTELIRVINYVKEGYKIIDYSLGNIRILDKNFNLNNIYYIPYQVNYDEIYNKYTYRPKDICSIRPTSGKHRKYIYDNMLSFKIFKLTPISGFKEKRDREILKHKMLLNVHFDETYNTYESIRCDRLIFNKVIIVSEYSDFRSVPEDIREFIVEFSNIEELKSKLETISNNPDKYYKSFWNNLDLDKIDTNRKKYFDYWLSTIITTENFNNNNDAYVINLDNRTDRWEQIQNSFKNSNITLVRVSAVKHKIGHLGCGLSFIKIIKLAKEKGLKTVLIFEDDNKPLDNFNKRWNTIKHWLDSNLDKWEIFNGGARFEGWGDITNEDIPESCKNIKLVNNIDNKEYLFTNDRILSTNWIYINSSVYNKILKWETQINQMFFNPSKDAIDRYITNLKEFNVQFCIPLLALQQSGKSDTDNIHADYDKKDRLIINIYKKIYDKYVYNK